jgi:hypothetical protein
MGRHEGKRPCGRPRRRWEDNVTIGVQEAGWGTGNGLMWLRIGTGDVKNAVIIFGFHMMRGASRLAAELLASQEVLFFKEFTYANMYMYVSIY